MEPATARSAGPDDGYSVLAPAIRSKTEADRIQIRILVHRAR